MRFDCAGAYGLHVNHRPATPTATQNPIKNLLYCNVDGFQEPFFLETIWKMTKTDPRKVSKWVSLFRAKVPWAPFGRNWYPTPFSKTKNWPTEVTGVPTELEISKKNDTGAPPKDQNIISKVHVERTWPGGLRGALSITRESQSPPSVNACSLVDCTCTWSTVLTLFHGLSVHYDPLLQMIYCMGATISNHFTNCIDGVWSPFVKSWLCLKIAATASMMWGVHW